MPFAKLFALVLHLWPGNWISVRHAAASGNVMNSCNQLDEDIRPHQAGIKHGVVHVFVSAAVLELWKGWDGMSVRVFLHQMLLTQQRCTEHSQNIHRMLHFTLHHRCEDSFGTCISDHIGSYPPHGVLAVASMFLAAGGAHFYHSPSSFLLGLSRRSDLLLLGWHIWHPFCNYSVKIIPNFECLPYLSSKIKVVREAPIWWSMVYILLKHDFLLQVKYMMEVFSLKGKSDLVGHDSHDMNARARMLDGRTKAFKAAVARFRIL